MLLNKMNKQKRFIDRYKRLYICQPNTVTIGHKIVKSIFVINEVTYSLQYSICINKLKI